MGSVGPSENNKMLLALKRAYVPVTAIEYTTLRSRKYEKDSTIEIPTDISFCMQSGNRVFILQKGTILVGDFNSMLFRDRVTVDFSVLGIEQLSYGAVVFGNNGLHFIDENLSLQRVTGVSTNSVKAYCSSGNVCYAVTEDNEVLAIVLEFPAQGRPYPVSTSISKAISAVDWGDNPQMVAIDNTLYIARAHDIYIYREGAWIRYDFGVHTIRKIGALANRLVVSFHDAFTLFEVPIVIPTADDFEGS